MTQPSHAKFKVALWQMPFIIGLAGLFSIGINFWRADGIPLVADWSVEARYADADGDSLIIAPELAELLFEQDGALFVDARPHHQFVQGHIRGALSLPWQDVDMYFEQVADRLDGPRTIIAYCDGESCDLSHELTLFLKSMGFENVRILVNGWTIWQQAGLPTDTGE
jgi:rhodanese-related sulfurtransferase